MTDSDTEKKHAVSFFGKMLTFSRLKLATNDLSEIEKNLAKHLSNKDSQIPVIIESDVEQDLKELIDLLWQWGLQPIGIVTGKMDKQAKELRLAIFPADGKRLERVKPKISDKTDIPAGKVIKPKKTESSPSEQPAKTLADAEAAQKNSDAVVIDDDGMSSMVYEQMLRSGQSLSHMGGDLVLTQGINKGAEAITDNNLHVYGRGLGRLVAGATGDQDAHIFCQRFNPSLVSVAGTYCLHDSIPEEVIDQPVQVSYKEDEGLIFRIIEED